jgi:hypothetical protein
MELTAEIIYCVHHFLGRLIADHAGVGVIEDQDRPIGCRLGNTLTGIVENVALTRLALPKFSVFSPPGRS